MNGNHRPTGIFMLNRPVDADACSLLDVAPTVYAALGIEGPEVEGFSLLEPYAASASTPAATTAAAYTPEQEAAVESRLRALGYFE